MTTPSTLRLAPPPAAAGDRPPPPSRSVDALVAVVALAGAAAIFLSSFSLAGGASPAPTAAGWALAGALAVGVHVLQRAPFVFPWRGEAVAIALDEAALLVALFALPPAVAPLIVAPAVALAQRARRRELRKAVFNVGLHAAAAGAAALVALAAGPHVGALPAALAAAALYCVATNAMVALVLSRLSGEGWGGVVRARFLLPVTLQVAVGAAVATALVALWQLHPAAVVAAAPMVLLARGYASLRAGAERRANAHDRLAQLTRHLSDNADEATVADRVLDACGRLFPSVRASLALDTPARAWSRDFAPGATRLDARALAAPVTARDGTRLGELRVEVRVGVRADDEHLEVLRMLAAEAAASLENARLYAAERHARAQAERAAAERAESLRALALSESRLQGILAHAPAAIFVKDAHGRYVLANRLAEQAADVAPGGLLGRTDFDVFPEHVARHIRGVDEDVLRTGAVRELDVKPPGLGGQRVFRSLKFPLLDAQGRPVAVGTIAADVTERKQAQAELDAARAQLAAKEKLSALGSLVSGVAHEIRTPLTYMNNHLFLVRKQLDRIAAEQPDALPQVEAARALLAAAEEGGDRVNHLVRDLRRFTQLRPDQRAAARLDEVVREALDLFSATNRWGARLDIDLAPVPPVVLDRVQVQQVALNLLNNAAEAGARTIRVATGADAGHVRLVVEDDGPGIPVPVRGRMFEPFFTTKPEGTGLGLSTTRRIVEGHEGRIECDSAPGRGTRFTVALPLGGPPG